MSPGRLYSQRDTPYFALTAEVQLTSKNTAEKPEKVGVAGVLEGLLCIVSKLVVSFFFHHSA